LGGFHLGEEFFCFGTKILKSFPHLYESVMLARGFEAIGSIWSVTSIGAFEKDASPIPSIISKIVDKFMNDYLAANPQK
jgi:hypothetical protein